MAHLNSTGPISIGALKELYQRNFFNLLEKGKPPRTIVWETSLMTPINLIVEYSQLKKLDIDQSLSIKNNEISPSPATSKSVFFVIPPNLKLMNLLDAYLGQEYKSGRRDKDYHIIFVPRKTIVCEKFLEEKKIAAKFKGIDEFFLDILPLDYDVLSMENSNCFSEMFLHNNVSCLHQLARGIMTLQAVYGIIPRIQGKGEKAKELTKILTRMRGESTMDDILTPPKFDNAIFLDRRVDMLTPLINQLTYEGLISEVFNIQYGQTKLPLELLEASAKPGDVKKVHLNSADDLFSELRDRNFATVGGIISKRAKEVSAEVSESKAARDISLLKKVVSNIPIVKQKTAALSLHTPIAEALQLHTSTEEFLDHLRCQQDFINNIETDKAHPFIEECIAKEDDINKVLRLICIQSYCNNGLKAKLLEYYKREILQVYGIEHALTLENVQQLGLISLQTPSSSWRPGYPTLCKTLQLLGDSGKDLTSLYSGYAPLSCRLIQFHTRPGWRSITEALALLPGPEVDETQELPHALQSNHALDHRAPNNRKTTLVVFIGGVTAAEVSALRLLSQMDEAPAEYIVLTTGMITHESLMNSISHTIKIKPLNPF